MDSESSMRAPGRAESYKKNYLLDFLGFIFGLSTALSAYINSSFLSQFMDEKAVSLVYVSGAVLSIISFVFFSRFLNMLGNYWMSVLLVFTNFLFLVSLAYASVAIAVVLFFIIHISLSALLSASLDIFVEHFSKNSDTGGIRGYFLTSMALAGVVAPSITGLMLTDSDYWRIYLGASVFLIPFILILLASFRDFKDPSYESTPIWRTILKVWRNSDIFGIFSASLTLRLFYSWMVIYTPLYLHNHLGFAWSEIGPMFTIMLLPFVLFEIPAGRLADRRFGEKEMMGLGFVIIAVATAALSFIAVKSFWLWTSLLFLSRVGASLVEITTESYFFKHIGSGDSNTLSFFRMTAPLALILGPLSATAFLFFFDFQDLFIILGAIVLSFGLYFSLRLKDTN